MKLIKEIYEKDLDLKNFESDSIRLGAKEQVGEKYYRLRKASRALVFWNDKIAVLKAAKLHIHKLPGGGIENSESMISGLHREVLEETGCKIDKIHELGLVIEYRDAIRMLQISYVFIGHVFDLATKPIFTLKEQNEGFKLAWFDVEEVINMMINIDIPDTYAGRFIHARDLAILRYYVRHKM